MILPSRPFGVVASTQTIMLKKVLAAADVTPDAVDWTDYTEGAGGIIGTAGGAETFSGINTTIDIYWQCVDCADGGTTYYKKNGGSWTALSQNTNLSISNGDTLDWGYQAETIFGGYREIRIYNDSDGDAVLDNAIGFFDVGEAVP